MSTDRIKQLKNNSNSHIFCDEYFEKPHNILKSHMSKYENSEYRKRNFVTDEMLQKMF